MFLRLLNLFNIISVIRQYCFLFFQTGRSEYRVISIIKTIVVLVEYDICVYRKYFCRGFYEYIGVLQEDVALKKRHEEGLKQMEEENLRKWEMEKAQNERELCELRSIRQTVTQELQGKRTGATYQSGLKTLLNRLFRHRSKKTPKLSVTGLCVGISPGRWIPRTKGQLRGKCFHLMTSSWQWGRDEMVAIWHFQFLNGEKIVGFPFKFQWNVPMGPVNKTATFAITLHPTGDRPLSEPMLVYFLDASVH